MASVKKWVWLVGHLEYEEKKTTEKCKTRAKLMRENNDNNNQKQKEENDKQTSISNDLVHGFTKSNTFFAFIS